MSETRPLHWHREPPASSHRFVADVETWPTRKGRKLALELIAYPDGQVNVSTCRIEGEGTRSRRIVQTQSLMFNDMNEAKDVIDLIADRLAVEAATGPDAG